MKRLLILNLIFLFFSFFVTSCDKKSDVDLYGSIEGIITDAVSNEPIKGALVTISPINTSKNTGSDGRYNFTNLEPTGYSVQVSNSGYETNNKTITVEPGELRNGDIQLSPIIPVLHISLTSLDYGNNLTSLPVEITNIGKGELEWTVNETVDWISVNPLEGNTTGETDNIIISVDRSGLAQGVYEQNINIISNGGNAIIAITLSVE